MICGFLTLRILRPAQGALLKKRRKYIRIYFFILLIFRIVIFWLWDWLFYLKVKKSNQLYFMVCAILDFNGYFITLLINTISVPFCLAPPLSDSLVVCSSDWPRPLRSPCPSAFPVLELHVWAIRHDCKYFIFIPDDFVRVHLEPGRKWLSRIELHKKWNVKLHSQIDFPRYFFFLEKIA